MYISIYTNTYYNQSLVLKSLGYDTGLVPIVAASAGHGANSQY